MNLITALLLILTKAHGDVTVVTSTTTQVVPGNFVSATVVVAVPPPTGLTVSPTVATALDVTKASTVSGFSKDATGVTFDWGFMTGVGAYLEYTLAVTKAQPYTLTMNYAVGSAASSGVDISVNGVKVSSDVLASTGGYGVYANAPAVTLNLPVGSVLMRITSNNANYINIAGITLTPGSAVVPPPPPPPPPSGAAQAFVSTLKAGINIERGRSWYMGDFGSGTQSYSYLKSLGITHVRLFYPWRPDMNMGGSAGPGIAPTSAEFGRIVTSAKNANAAGLKVFLDLTDVMEVSMFSTYGSLIDGYLNMASQAIAAANFDPTMLAVGAVNEYAEGTNGTWNPIRAHVLSLLRTNLPKLTLTTGACDWKYYNDLMSGDFQVSTDTNVIYEVHTYDSNNNQASHWADISTQLGAWSKAHGNVPIVTGEAGMNPDPGQSSYPGMISAIVQSGLSIHPSPWAITDGGSDRLNLSTTDIHLTPAEESAYKASIPMLMKAALVKKAVKK